MVFQGSKQHAFSLIELSIVLVILGLLTGGILTGQNLIRAAELRSVTTEFQAYQTAVNTFRDKYFALPGDMPNATDFWGEIDGTHSSCIATASPDNRRTCNGNGDGLINAGYTYAVGGYERFHFWLHLSNAGLIQGSYSGLTATAGDFASVVSVNVPKMKVGNSGWMAVSLNHDNSANSIAEWFPRSYNYAVALTATGPILTPEELWNIDTKMDDGKPATGDVFTFKTTGTWSPRCATADVLSADYDLNLSEKVCNFSIGFLTIKYNSLPILC